MCPVHQTFSRGAGQYPGQVRYLRDVRLSVEDSVFRVQPKRQPRSRYLKRRAIDAFRVFGLGVQAGQALVGVIPVKAASSAG